MPCVRADVTRPVVSSANGSVLYWPLNVAVPKMRGGSIEDSWVRRPSVKEYGMGFCRVGKVCVVVACSTGVVAIFANFSSLPWCSRVVVNRCKSYRLFAISLEGLYQYSGVAICRTRAEQMSDVVDQQSKSNQQKNAM